MQEGLTNALKYSADRTAAFGLSLDRETLGIRLSNPAGARRGNPAGGQRAARAGRGCVASANAPPSSAAPPRRARTTAGGCSP